METMPRHQCLIYIDPRSLNLSAIAAVVCRTLSENYANHGKTGDRGSRLWYERCDLTNSLIDAGFPRKEAAVFGAIRGLGRSPDQLKHLIFTHGQPIHIGRAAAIVRETGARTYMHPLDIPIAESGGPFRPLRAAPGLLRRVAKPLSPYITISLKK